MQEPQIKPYDHDHEEEISLFAKTNFRNQERKFGIKTDDRRRHMYVIGKTGMGKTTMLENMVLSDIYAGHGVCYIDPHGDTAHNMLDYIPSHRVNDVVYFSPGDVEHPIGFNIFEVKNEQQKHLIASGLMGVFKKIWPDVWSARMEYILMNTILALLDAPGASLLGITRILVDDEYRKKVVAMIQDPVVKTFWVKEFASWQEKYRTEAIAPVQNKVGQFLSSRIIRNIVAQVKSTIDMREIMDQRKIFLVNLSKGLIGEENMRLLGGMIITKLQMSVMERVDMPEHLRQDFYLYVDEFQNFANESFASILSEARKYRLNLTVAHQYIEQMDEVTRAAIFGNVGTMIIFRVGAADAEVLEQEFSPVFTAEDLVNLRKFDIYLKLMINGAASEPFSATTLPPIANPTGSEEKVIKTSRERYARPRKMIEGKILRWSGLAPGEEKEDDAENDIVSAASELGVNEQDLKDLSDSSPSVREAEPPASKKKKEAKYQIPCSVCGEVQKLTFEPDWSKPWFCKEHLDMRGKIPTKELKFYNPEAQAKMAAEQKGEAPPESEPKKSDAPKEKEAEQGKKPVQDRREKPAPSRQDRAETAKPKSKSGKDKRKDRRGVEQKNGKPNVRQAGKSGKAQDKQDSIKRPNPVSISESSPVVADEESEAVSLSALASRAEKTKPQKEESDSSGNSENQSLKTKNNSERPPSPEGKSDKESKGDGNDQNDGPKPIEPGQVIKF